MSKPVKITCFKTSIWDETLYRVNLFYDLHVDLQFNNNTNIVNALCFCFKAWSSIVYKLIPNVKELEQSLKMFADLMDGDEVLLFERATFLVISHCQRTLHRDVHRFEKVSNIIKQFKLSCRLVLLCGICKYHTRIYVKHDCVYY